jgi:S1-C subfamily serine protease
LAGVTLGEPSETNAGVVVLRVERETKAWSAGLRPQDLILSINRTKINKLEDVEKAIALNASGILLNIRRGNSALFIVIR